MTYLRFKMVGMIAEGVSVGQWVDTYEANSTRNNHKSGMIKFFESVYPKIPRKEIKARLDELSLQYIEEVKNGLRRIDTDIANFNKATRGYAPATRNVRFSSIRLFFKINKLEVNEELWRITTTTGKRRPRAEGISKEHLPTHEELARIVNYLPSHGKAVTLMLESSGMRPGEPFELRLDQIVNLDERPMRIDLEAEQTKTGRPRYTFISDEAKGFLEEWLRHRIKFTEDRKNKARGLNKQNKRDDKLFTFTYQNFLSIWKTALKNAGLYEVDKVTNRTTIPPKILRKFFRTRGDWSNPEVAEFLMGHTVGDIGRINGKNNGIVKVYAKYDQVPEQVRAAYIEVEPNLTILGSTPELYELREETSELREIAQSTVDKLLLRSGAVTFMQRDIDYLKNDNKKLKEVIGRLRADMAFKWGEMKSMIEQLGRELNIEIWDQVQAIPKETEPSEDAEREDAKRVKM